MGGLISRYAPTMSSALLQFGDKKTQGKKLTCSISMILASRIKCDSVITKCVCLTLGLNVETKLYLRLNKYHAMNTYEGVEVKLHSFLT